MEVTEDWNPSVPDFKEEEFVLHVNKGDQFVLFEEFKGNSLVNYFLTYKITLFTFNFSAKTKCQKMLINLIFDLIVLDSLIL